MPTHATPPTPPVPPPFRWYFSAGSRLAYRLGNLYGQHYVWVSPVTCIEDAPHCEHLDLSRVELVPSSLPGPIFESFRAAVMGPQDQGNHLIQKLKDHHEKLLEGAEAVRRLNIIDDYGLAQAIALLDGARDRDYWPVLYMIDGTQIDPATRLVHPPLADKAHPLSPEYIIPDLKPGEYRTFSLPAPFDP